MTTESETTGTAPRWQSPLIPFCLVQLASGLLLFVVLVFYGRSQGVGLYWPGPLLLCLMQGGLSVLLSTAFNRKGIILFFHLILPFALLAGKMLALPSWLYLVIVVIIGLVYRNVLRDRVPLYLTNQTTWAALAGLLPEKGGHFCDLGSGLGGTLFYLGRIKPDGHFHGIESAPIPWAVSRCRALFSGLGNVTIIYGDIWQKSLKDYDAVYCFLSPVPMADIYKKAQAEMKPGSLLISNSFDVPGHPADDIIELEDGRKTKLYLWRF